MECKRLRNSIMVLMNEGNLCIRTYIDLGDKISYFKCEFTLIKLLFLFL